LRVPVSFLPAFAMPSEVRSGLSVKAFFERRLGRGGVRRQRGRRRETRGDEQSE
jgi:hypothetical protein